MNKRLGRGLDALIPSLSVDENDLVLEVSVDDIRPNPYQPRKEFEPKALEELSASIKEHGIIQPLIVRKSLRGFEIVAGERRLRAAKLARLQKVPVVVKEFTERQLMEIALIENLQRENLNAIEIAQAYQKLMDEFQLTQEEVAKKVGKSRPHVANFLRLLQLPAKIQEYVSRGTLSMGHARSLISIEDEQKKLQLAEEVIKKGLSVRQLEEMVKKVDKKVSRETKRRTVKKDLMLVQFEEKLRVRLGTSVKIKRGREKGKIEIEFYSQDDLNRILEIIGDGVKA
ncbi:stage 0 sporulation protein Spo0J [Bacillaceae bacterium]